MKDGNEDRILYNSLTDGATPVAIGLIGQYPSFANLIIFVIKLQY